ncbi:hypothetical protein E2C01_019407 [Portunus trituberculatus]|uniref:Uncharacterized protein n=1 Tax=Portunus trituberculatus TaxID=210409 RepID=A0A5B7DX44_PORTR|nr:hypothetical protein [Portunus trituberculatus]
MTLGSGGEEPEAEEKVIGGHGSDTWEECSPQRKVWCLNSDEVTFFHYILSQGKHSVLKAC